VAGPAFPQPPIPLKSSIIGSFWGLSFDHFEPTLGDEKKRKKKKRKEEGCKVYVT
jgi:hypothetical protein